MNLIHVSEASRFVAKITHDVVLGRDSAFDDKNPGKLSLQIPVTEAGVSRKQCSINVIDKGFEIKTTPGAKNSVNIRSSEGSRVLTGGKSVLLNHGDLIEFDVWLPRAQRKYVYRVEYDNYETDLKKKENEIQSLNSSLKLENNPISLDLITGTPEHNIHEESTIEEISDISSTVLSPSSSKATGSTFSSTTPLLNQNISIKQNEPPSTITNMNAEVSSSSFWSSGKYLKKAPLLSSTTKTTNMNHTKSSPSSSFFSKQLSTKNKKNQRIDPPSMSMFNFVSPKKKKTDNDNDNNQPQISEKLKDEHEDEDDELNQQMELNVGCEVMVPSRMGPGMNKPGGAAIVFKVNKDQDTGTLSYDVKYVLGSREKNLPRSLLTVKSLSQAGLTSRPRVRRSPTEKSSLTCTTKQNSPIRSNNKSSASSSSLKVKTMSSKKQSMFTEDDDFASSSEVTFPVPKTVNKRSALHQSKKSVVFEFLIGCHVEVRQGVEGRVVEDVINEHPWMPGVVLSHHQVITDGVFFAVYRVSLYEGVLLDANSENIRNCSSVHDKFSSARLDTRLDELSLKRKHNDDVVVGDEDDDEMMMMIMQLPRRKSQQKEDIISAKNKTRKIHTQTTNSALRDVAGADPSTLSSILASAVGEGWRANIRFTYDCVNALIPVKDSGEERENLPNCMQRITALKHLADSFAFKNNSQSVTSSSSSIKLVKDESNENKEKRLVIGGVTIMVPPGSVYGFEEVESSLLIINDFYQNNQKHHNKKQSSSSSSASYSMVSYQSKRRLIAACFALELSIRSLFSLWDHSHLELLLTQKMTQIIGKGLNKSRAYYFISTVVKILELQEACLLINDTTYQGFPSQ